MNRDLRRRRTLAVSAIVLVVASCLRVGMAQSTRPAIAVTGRVVGPDGTLIAGATVQVRDDRQTNSILATGQTDLAGVFRLSCSAEDRIVVQVFSDGLSPRSYNLPLVEDDDPLDVRLERGTSVRVPIIGPDGKPAANVRVAAGGPREYASDAGGVVSDLLGFCTFPDLPRNAHIIFSVIDERFIKTTGAWDTFDDDTSDAPPIKLTPAGLIEGRVLDPTTSAPLAGVSVAGNGTADGRTWYGTSAVTDAQGKFRLTQLRPGDYNLRASAPPSLEDHWSGALSAPVKVTEGQTATVADLQFVAVGTIGGKAIVAGRGEPVVGVTITARSPSGTPASRASFSAKSGPDGTFVLHVAPGTYDLLGFVGLGSRYIEPGSAARGVRGAARTPPRPSVSVKSGENATANMEFALNPTPPLRGTVVDEQARPVQGAIVRLGQNSDVINLASGRGSTAYTDAAGRFELPVASAGLTVWARKGRLAMEQMQTVRDDQRDITLVLAANTAGSITIHAVDELGRPIANAAVTVNVSDLYQGYAPKLGRTGADGAYVIAPTYPDRSYNGSVIARNYAPGTFRLDSAAREQKTAQPIVLRRTDRSITGRVLDQQGQPVAGVQVRTDAYSGPSGTRIAITDANGEFKLDRLIRGNRQRISAIVDERIAATVTIDETAEEALIVLTPR